MCCNLFRNYAMLTFPLVIDIEYKLISEKLSSRFGDFFDTFKNILLLLKLPVL